MTGCRTPNRWATDSLYPEIEFKTRPRSIAYILGTGLIRARGGYDITAFKVLIMTSPQNYHDRRTHRGNTITAGGGGYVAEYVRTHLKNKSGINIIIRTAAQRP